MTGFQYRYVGVIGVGDREKKRPKKTESVFRFRFFWATEKNNLKSWFSVGKKREKLTEKNDFRFSVHNPDYSTHHTAVMLLSDLDFVALNNEHIPDTLHEVMSNPS